MGLLGDWLGSKRMKDPVRGTAQVVGASGAPDHATSANCKLTLVVNADGVPPTPIQHTCIAPISKWPYPGTTLPVTVDRADPERLKVEWDEIQTGSAQAWQSAEAIAASMGGATAAPQGSGGITIHAGGQMDDATRAQLAALGLDPEALIAQAQALRAAAPPPAGDDVSDQLHKLAELHASGVLTDDEFAAAKRKVLGA